MSVDWSKAIESGMRISRIRKPEPGVEIDVPGLGSIRMADATAIRTAQAILSMVTPHTPQSDVAAAAVAVEKSREQS